MSKRNGHGRSARLVVAGALIATGVVTLPSSAGAAGSGYYGIQCHDWYRAANQMGVHPHQHYSIADQCQTANARLSITNASGAVINQGAQFTLTAPPGTTIREVHMVANLRRGSHHLAQIGVWNGTTVDVLANGPDSDPGWQEYHFGGLDHPQLLLRLYCSAGNCPADGTAHLYARNIAVLLVDHHDPSTPALGGTLLQGAWVRGDQTLSGNASDVGSGISALSASVNGTQVAAAGSCNTGGPGWPFTGLLVPCQAHASFGVNLNTASAPFQNGANTIVSQAVDFTGYNAGGTATQTVRVDNKAPSVAFANAQDPEDPELIRAAVSDEHSGVASAKLAMRAVGASEWQPLDGRIEGGEVRARIDGAAVPAGEYEFRAVAIDVAGNVTETTQRANGEPMKLTLPLRSPVTLQTHLGGGASKGQTVPYGTDAAARGRLLDEQGNPIAGREILVMEHFGNGALIRERPTVVTTDEDGRFRSKVPAGPTRKIEASFGGTPKYSPAQKNVGKFTVKSRASFKIEGKGVPEGKAAVFKGKVGHFGARIPSGGKLLELQVRLKTGRWDTVGEAFRTNEKGHYKRRYRFGKHYTQDALFRFRVKVQKEANWPYKRGASKQRKVIVRAR